MDEPQTNELEEKLAECGKRCEEYLAGWKRAQADLINYKKEREKERAALAEFAHEQIVRKLVEVVDQFDGAIQTANLPTAQAGSQQPTAKGHELSAENEWAKGFGAIRQNLRALLEEEGVKKMDTAGADFNPELHEAVSMDETGESGKITKEVRAGYIIHDRVLRPARVVVGK